MVHIEHIWVGAIQYGTVVYDTYHMHKPKTNRSALFHIHT